MLEIGDLIEIHGADSPDIEGKRGVVITGAMQPYFLIEINNDPFPFHHAYFTSGNLTVIERYRDKVIKILGEDYLA